MAEAENITDATVSRFFAKVGPRQTTGCRPWLAGTFRRGYGKFRWNGKFWRAHRFAWLLNFGPIPPGLLVCHSCDNPGCVAADHLWLGTCAENQTDMAQKGRSLSGDRNYTHTHPEVTRGAQNGRAKLTDAQVREIRDRCAAGETQRRVAREFGMKQAQISKIVLRQSWRHLL